MRKKRAARTWGHKKSFDGRASAKILTKRAARTARG